MSLTNTFLSEVNSNITIADISVAKRGHVVDFYMRINIANNIATGTKLFNFSHPPATSYRIFPLRNLAVPYKINDKFSIWAVGNGIVNLYTDGTDSTGIYYIDGSYITRN